MNSSSIGQKGGMLLIEPRLSFQILSHNFEEKSNKKSGMKSVSLRLVIKTLSHVQTPPSSRKVKGSGVTSPNLWASSRSVEWPIISQSSVYWKEAEVRTSTSH